MRAKYIIFNTLFAAALATGDEASAQIIFEDPRPQVSPQFNGGIGKKSIHMAPMQRIAKPSMSRIPMTGFKQHVIRPNRINMVPLGQNSLEHHQMRMNQITFNPMIRSKNNIRPDGIKVNNLMDVIHTPKKMSFSPPIEKPHWAFNPTLQGHVKATTRFDSSIKAPMPDYDSPYFPDVPVTASHPMAW